MEDGRVSPDDGERSPGAGDRSPDDGDRARVAAALEQLRAGVRQRRGELATMATSDVEAGGASAEVRGRLLQLRQTEYVREPVPLSHRPRLGGWIVLARKAGYKLFGRWLVRPLLEQQNAFNQAAAAALQELMENEERLARQMRDLTARLEALRATSERAGNTSKNGPSAEGP